MVLQEINASVSTCCIYRTSSILYAKPNVSWMYSRELLPQSLLQYTRQRLPQQVCHLATVNRSHLKRQKQNLFLLSSLMGAWCRFRTGNSGLIMLSFCSMKPVSVVPLFFLIVN